MLCICTVLSLQSVNILLFSLERVFQQLLSTTQIYPSVLIQPSAALWKSLLLYSLFVVMLNDMFMLLHACVTMISGSVK